MTDTDRKVIEMMIQDFELNCTVEEFLSMSEECNDDFLTELEAQLFDN